MAEKRLTRRLDNKMIGGVCSGLADYFNVDPTIVRVLFVITFLSASAGFWIYIILWIVMPAQ
jgi:phage shock protein C